MDKVTGNHGPFLPDNIRRILAVRDEAAETLAGRGARLLARLDRLYYEGALAIGDAPWRERLFTALQQNDETGITEALNALKHVTDLDPDSAQPLLAWASRLLSSDNVIARNRIDPTHWEEVMNQIREAAARDDIIALGEYLRLAAATTRP